jgi:hypothetical protein
VSSTVVAAMFALGASAAALWAAGVVRRARRTLRGATIAARLRRVALRDVPDVATGVFEVTVSSQSTVVAPHSKREVVWWSARRETPIDPGETLWKPAGRAASEAPFRVKDDGADGWVVPTGAAFDLPEECLLTDWEDESGSRVEGRAFERRLEPGQRLFLVGSALRRPAPGGAKAAGPHVPVLDATKAETLHASLGDPTTAVRAKPGRARLAVALGAVCLVWAVAAALIEIWLLTR